MTTFVLEETKQIATYLVKGFRQFDGRMPWWEEVHVVGTQPIDSVLVPGSEREWIMTVKENGG